MKKIYNILMATAIALGTFTSCEDVPMPFNNPLDYQKPVPEEVVIDPAGNGTKDSPYNVAGALAYLATLEADVESSTDIYITGVVTSVSEAFSTQYGNAQFVISDNDEGVNKFTFYRGLYLGNKKYSNESDVNVQEGDVVVICGRIVNYRGSTPETVQNKAYVVSINGKTVEVPTTTTADPKGAGSQTDPYNVAGVLNYINTLGSDVTSPNEVYVKGKVKAVTEQFSTQYGNATFTMVDDGFDAVFTAYRVLYLGNVKYTSGDQLKEGDEVIVCGKVVNYRGNTPETSQNTGYVYSLNGKTGGGSSTPSEGGTGEAKGTGTQADPFNVAAAIAKCKEVGETASTESYYIKGIAKADYTVGSYKNIEVAIVDSEGDAESFMVYRCKGVDGKDIPEGFKVSKGDVIIVYGPVVNYKNNTPETATGAYVVSVNGKAPDEVGGSTGGDTGGESSGNSKTFAMADLGLDNAADLNTQTLSDGTTLTFAAEENSNAPKYYTSGAAARVYAKNSLTIKSAGKNITKVVLNCVANYAGNEQIFGEADGKKVTVKREDPTVTFSDFSSQTIKIVNDYTEAKAGTQLRIVSIEITYAE